MMLSANMPVGATLGGRFELLRRLGSVGRVMLFIARDLTSGAEVELKVLTKTEMDEEEDDDAGEAPLRRLRREAQRLATLTHPNVARFIADGEDGQFFFVVREHVRGRRLSEVLAEHGPLSLAEFVPWAVHVLRAVGFANSHGIMVREVSSDNVIVGDDGVARLLDLGLARLENDADRITRIGLVGNAAYLAPEQVMDAPVDVRVDVYALGVLFFEMLTGRMPLWADTLAALLVKKVHERAPPLVDALPRAHDIPEDLADLVDRCLAREPRDRPESADILLEELIDHVPSALINVSGGSGRRLFDRRSGSWNRLREPQTEPFPNLVTPITEDHSFTEQSFTRETDAARTAPTAPQEILAPQRRPLAYWSGPVGLALLVLAVVVAIVWVMG